MAKIDRSKFQFVLPGDIISPDVDHNPHLNFNIVSKGEKVIITATAEVDRKGLINLLDQIRASIDTEEK